MKLCCPPDSLPALRRHPLFDPGTDGRAHRACLLTHYYDTPQGHLGRAGYALRVREEAGSFWLALKTRGHARAGLHVRGEWEVETPDGRPDLARLPAGAPVMEVRAAMGSHPLVPLITTDFERTRVEIENGGSRIELALDVGEIRAGGRVAPLLEVELEVKAGPVAPLFALALALGETIPLTFSHYTKAERGVALLTGRFPDPVPPPPRDPLAGLTAGMLAAEAGRRLGLQALDDLLAQAPRVLGDDATDGLHQTRVALRRLRSILALFAPARPAPEALRDDLRWLMSCLGPARDADVFMTELLPDLRSVLDAEPGGAALVARLTEEREALRAAARSAIEGPRFATLTLRMRLWLEMTDPPPLRLGALASRALAKRWRRVRRAGRDFDTLSEGSRHALRVRLKKMRYALEVLSPLYPERPTRDFVRALKDIQEILGQANDGAVARDHLRALAFTSGNPALAFAAGRVTARLEGRRDLEPRARDAWSHLTSLGVPWEP